jgi:hypothetical protein
MDTSRKREIEYDEDLDEEPAYKKHAAEPDCKELDKKFIEDTEASLLKSRGLKQCSFDSKNDECYRKNPAHFKECSHKHHCNAGNIADFKEDTDIFIENTYNIYICNNNDFSTAWHTKVGSDRGEHKAQLKTFKFDEYDTFIFYMLANIALHLNEYEEKYGDEFLKNMLFAFETNDNTGLFPIKQYGSIRKVFTRYAKPERENGQIDYRLSNTTLRGIIENKSQNRSTQGGKKTKKRKRKHTKNKHTKKRHNKQIKRK